jgi:bacteriorhodopsin
MVACGFMGAAVSPEHKYFWWGAGMLFFVVLIYMLFQELNKAVGDGRVGAYDGETLKGLTYLTICVWCVYPIVWIMGQEGAGLASLNAEETTLTLADLLVSKQHDTVHICSHTHRVHTCSQTHTH